MPDNVTPGCNVSRETLNSPCQKLTRADMDTRTSAEYYLVLLGCIITWARYYLSALLRGRGVT